MPSRLQKLLGIPALIVILGLFGFVWTKADECSRAQDCRGYRGATYSRPDQKREETLWDKTTSDPIALYTFLLAIFTAGLAIASIFQGYFLIRADRTARLAADAAKEASDIATVQAGHMERYSIEAARLAEANEQANILSREALTAGQRAWLRTEVAITGVRYDPFNRLPLQISLSVMVENIGKSPAIEVFLAMRLVLHLESFDAFNERIPDAQIALGVRARDEHFEDQIIFPGEKREMGWTPTVDKKRIDEAISEIQKIADEQNDFAEESGRELVSPDWGVRPILLGCVDYKFPFSAKSHQTWFVWEVMLEGRRPFILNESGTGDIPAQNFALYDHWFGTKFAD
jgi:hypothetical protein